MDELTLLRHIADAAFTVRDRQRQYFATRNPAILHLAKSAEQHLDNLLDQRRTNQVVTTEDLFGDFSPPRPP